MHRFIVVYRAPLVVTGRSANATPEQTRKGLQSRVGRTEKLGPTVLDAGRPLEHEMNVGSAGIVLGGSEVIGTSILQAESMGDALGMVKPPIISASRDSTPTTKAQANEVLHSGLADAVSFGRGFLVNPDLPFRLQHDLPWNPLRSDALHTPGPMGYTDYPRFDVTDETNGV